MVLPQNEQQRPRTDQNNLLGGSRSDGSHSSFSTSGDRPTSARPLTPRQRGASVQQSPQRGPGLVERSGSLGRLSARSGPPGPAVEMTSSSARNSPRQRLPGHPATASRDTQRPNVSLTLQPSSSAPGSITDHPGNPNPGTAPQEQRMEDARHHQPHANPGDITIAIPPLLAVPMARYGASVNTSIGTNIGASGVTAGQAAGGVRSINCCGNCLGETPEQRNCCKKCLVAGVVCCCCWLTGGGIIGGVVALVTSAAKSAAESKKV